MSDNTPIPTIDDVKLNSFGSSLFALFGTHKTDRKAAEEHWLRNLRQFRGIYDPEVIIPSDCSRAYPKLTRWKVIGTVARLMQMLFPQTEKNYGIKQSAMPDLATEQLQEVLDKLVAAKAGEGDPTKVILTDEEIEKAIVAYASGKAARMEVKIQDDLDGMEFITLARRVVFSAVLYNVGLLKGPFHEKVPARTWKRDENTGKYAAIEVTKYKPKFEFLRVWDWYPDMTANNLREQDGTFERHVMTRQMVEELGDRPDFLKDRINKWLADHIAGNHEVQWWESSMKGEPKSDKTTTATQSGRKYDVLSYRGNVAGHDLRAAGVEIADADLGKSLAADCWMIDNIVIKLKLAPLGAEVRQYHEFVFEEDDLSLLGNGQCDTLRDSQLSLCETVRAALDNQSVIGPMVEVNDDLVAPGQDLTIRKNMTIHREGDGAQAQYPAVRNLTIDSHLSDSVNMIKLFLDFADKESGLPPPSLGDTSQGGSEALRTTQNASMFLGAAALPIRDTVRNYDTFTISFVSALVKWNMKYDANPTRDGDHDVVARGSTSLIAKEALGQNLAVFKQTVQPEDWPYLKRRALLVEMMKVHDLPLDDLLEDEEIAKGIVDAQAKAQERQIEDQAALVHAQVEEVLGRAFEHAAKARSEDAGINIDVFQALMDALRADGEQTVHAAKAVAALRPPPAPKPAAKKK